MDAKIYKYKNKIWNILPNSIFKLFHKPIIYKNCIPTGIITLDTVPENKMVLTIQYNYESNFKEKL
jgi:hypothetical protein